MNSKSIVIIYNATHHVLLFKSELIKSIRENGYRVVVLASVDDYTEKLKEIVDEFHEIEIFNMSMDEKQQIKLSNAPQIDDTH